ncbi:2,3-bisphosphoglycerate-independent phosphoglycerate mutase [Pseudoruegeria sp. SHC-113]|uniref:2,3-bisphosphoglycerate-independent phosphoglycerate mutase n=1 Tax=Pseudoruegeria sp. SHC-113 TaxID=2855439 RepID=UPI0021BB0E24|nr:2,3-bisphosphoglycerate-independent phosphoglycerate mutase [Pseudoruegeria sp. SHC-113]MCT8158773.1 2,3-bisphosphoglycerate-independent phosphoglycerate mutase [Pseudoruegeria sp. SHC-113]
MTTPKPVVLCILDGWGHREEIVANAPAQAHTPTFDAIMASCPHNLLTTHGPDAGLPTGQMGNSEVGHTNIGAGRVVAMDLGQIDLAIEDGSFATNEALQGFIATLKANGGTAQIMGLVSPGGVHSHQNHIVEAAKAITAAGVPAQIHAITDGRDVAPKSADSYLKAFEEALPEGATIGSLVGRYFALDRDNRWERVQQAFDVVVSGQGNVSDTAQSAISESWARGETDEFIKATKLAAYQPPANGDGLLFINFRADRAREILAALADPDFAEFDASARPSWGAVCGMVEYSDRHNSYMQTLFPKRKIVNTLGEWVSKQGKTQFRLAETEKYPHVTFFLNGGKEVPEPGEDRYMPKSPKVATYDLQPEMSAGEVTEAFVAAIEKGYDLIVTNYANPDMVGHTGDLGAAIKACEAVDAGLGEVVEALKKAGGAMIVTADHGNCEMMQDPETGGPHTAHTLNPVPVVLVGGPQGVTLREGRLADLAPTVLDLMGLQKPAEMTGESLIQR